LVDGLLRGDSAARGEFYTKQFNIGAMNQDEIRAAENRDPLPNGEGQKFYVPLNMIATNGDTPQNKRDQQGAAGENDGRN
jgi:hypothetical protein